jgi:hypothetical protein
LFHGCLLPGCLFHGCLFHGCLFHGCLLWIVVLIWSECSAPFPFFLQAYCRCTSSPKPTAAVLHPPSLLPLFAPKPGAVLHLQARVLYFSPQAWVLYFIPKPRCCTSSPSPGAVLHPQASCCISSPRLLLFLIYKAAALHHPQACCCTSSPSACAVLHPQALLLWRATHQMHTRPFSNNWFLPFPKYNLKCPIQTRGTCPSQSTT